MGAQSLKDEDQAMTKIICDAALREKLHGLAEPLELCDEAGRVFARVVPFPDLEPDVVTVPRMSKADLRRRRMQVGKTFTTAEVLAHLETL